MRNTRDTQLFATEQKYCRLILFHHYISLHLRSTGHGDDLLEEGWGFTPKCMMDDAERFNGCLALTALCTACGEVRTMFLLTSFVADFMKKLQTIIEGSLCPAIDAVHNSMRILVHHNRIIIFKIVHFLTFYRSVM